MPVQINELTIRVAVQDAAVTANVTTNPQSATDTQVIIKQCVEEVMEALQRKNER